MPWEESSVMSLWRRELNKAITQQLFPRNSLKIKTNNEKKKTPAIITSRSSSKRSINRLMPEVRTHPTFMVDEVASVFTFTLG